MKMATLGWRTFPNGACTGRCTALDFCVHALYIHERHSNIFVCTDYVCKQVRPTMRPCVQKVKDGRAQIAALKEQISVQNRASHIEETYTSRQLTCGNECSTRLQQQQLQDLQQELAKLNKMAVLEEHAHAAASTHLDKLQAELSSKVAHWNARTQGDVQAKEVQLDVRSVQPFWPCGCVDTL